MFGVLLVKDNQKCGFKVVTIETSNKPRSDLANMLSVRDFSLRGPQPAGVSMAEAASSATRPSRHSEQQELRYDGFRSTLRSSAYDP